MLVVVFLSVLAAFLFALSAAVQQRAAQQNSRPYSAQQTGSRLMIVFLPLIQLARRLVRSPLWLAGWTINLVGFMAQAVALHLGSVAVVQPLLVTQLLFALPLAAAWNHRRLTRWDWLAASAVCGGLVVFLAVRGIAPLDADPDRWRAFLAIVSAAGLVCLLVAAAAGRPPFQHAFLIATAAGVCFAITAVLIKLTATDLVERGVVATALDWPGYVLAASTLIGLVLEQGAFAAGSLPTAVAAMTITNTLASYTVGVLAFHTVLPTSPGALAALAGAGALICLGVVGLAQCQERQPQAGSVATPAYAEGSAR
jgi:drug/metabolite transporter (DMT)-like permease